MGSCQTIPPHFALNMESPIIFTRYLYLKDEVLLSLLVSLLNKKDAAIYWAYELYYSGFEEELFQYLWKIYYDFYYTLNPSFQEYFAKKYTEWAKITSKDRKRSVVFIIGNLLIRPHNLDVFMLRQSIIYTKDEPPSAKTSLTQLLESKDYLQIAFFIFERKSDYNSIQILKETIAYFLKNGLKMDTEKTVKKWKKNAGFLQIDESIQLLAFIIHHFSLLSQEKMGKKLYISVEQHNIVSYETIFKSATTNNMAYKILPLAYIYAIDEDNYLSLFQLDRNKILMDDPTGLQKIYWYHWEYYASFSPIWFNRIRKCKGKRNDETKRIDFPECEETDWPEEFYSQFGYEPDEQKREIQEKSIQSIAKQRTWTQFYDEHGKNGIYKPTTDILSEMKFVIY